jgi:PAS domain S-box-containing protein
MFRLFVLFIALLGQVSIVQAQTHSVLLIHSYHSGMPWTDAQQKGFSDTLHNSGLNIDLYIEYLDTLRYRDQKEAMRENLHHTLLSKFKRRRLEAIAVTDNNALDFILDERPQLAPGVPVVFCGINGLDPDIRKRYANITGVAEEAAFKDTLEVMEQLLPGRRILVLGERSATFSGNYASLRKANQQRSNPSKLELFDDPVLSHIEARVGRAGPDTSVFLLNRPVDEAGETVNSATAVSAISAASKQPLFSVWDYMFGHGIVGGKLTSGEAHGEIAARQLIRILHGEAADSIPIEWESANRYFFDYTQLHRFGLQDKPLPEGAVLINRPTSFYELNSDKVLLVAGVFLLLLLFGIRLLILNKSLKESRNLLDSIVNNIPVMVFLKRASDLSFVLFNHAGETLLGHRRDELLGQNDYDFFPKQQADFFVGKDREVLKQKGVVDIPEEPIETPNGTRILHTRKLALRNIQDQPTHLLGISEDITERKQVEEALKKSEALLSASQHLAKVGGWEFDIETGKSVWSDELYRIHELPKQTEIDHIPESLKCYRPQDRAIISEAFEKVCEKGEPYDLEFPFTTYKGNHLWIRTAAQPVYEDGRIVRVVGNIVDITERKRAEEELVRYKEHLEETIQLRTGELRLARDEAEAANKAKSVFLANMSHELRTPLNAILGLSQLMRRDTTLSSDQLDTLEIINHSGEHLLQLINDVLEIAKIEAGKQQLEIATFDLHTMAREMADMMRLRAQQKGLRLELDQSSRFPRYIKGDEAHLRQILVNLLGNAVKFTTKGSVTLRLGVKRNKPQQLVIEVEDTGPGIKKADQQLLFKPFVQLPNGAAQGGTGLGLTIVKQFVELMNGRVSVESTKGKGSLFRVVLPFEAADEAEIPAVISATFGEVSGLAPGQPSYRILIAEDQRDNQLLLSKLMTDIRQEVRIADNGEQCVQLFQSWRPDLIWMDWRMPVMDGAEATRAIRGLNGGDKVKIVAVTASAFKEELSELQVTGMDDYVSKPFRINEIYECLSRQLGIEYSYREVKPVVTVTPESLTPKRLLGVSEKLREKLRSALESLESERINIAIEQIGEADADLAQLLKQATDNFDYPAILAALNPDARE